MDRLFITLAVLLVIGVAVILARQPSDCLERGGSWIVTHHLKGVGMYECVDLTVTIEQK